MNDASVFFDNAELALAAYADLVAGESTLSQKQKLMSAGMTDTQINEFSLRWPDVVAVINDDRWLFSGTGLSATVFRNGADGWKHRNGKNLIRAGDGIGTEVDQ